nr:NLR family pyrin domain containing 3 [Danio rerio]
MEAMNRLMTDMLEELVEAELKQFTRQLWMGVKPGVDPIPRGKLENKDRQDVVDCMVQHYSKDAGKIAVQALRSIKQNERADRLELNLRKDDDFLGEVLKKHKESIKASVDVFEGKKDNKTDINKVYTELFITEGDMTDVCKEHEVQKFDLALQMPRSEDKPIDCNEIFNLLRGKDKGNVVLTKGIAGIGKTFSVNKFILDWAEGRANLDVDCMFLLPFREINLMIKDGDVSLHKFLLKLFPDITGVETTPFYEKCKLLFIFDGLDESRLDLNFNLSSVDDVHSCASIDGLFTSLIKGRLLRSSLIWVTSRPAAANRIPSYHVGLFTEVRGFTDKQKEEYFRKKVPDEDQASRIISHIRTSRSLYIMCHIPVFCWIIATVLQDILQKNKGEDIPSTLTEMYIHFLLIQMNIKNQKYDEKLIRDRTELLGSNRDMISKLAKLAFEQLKKENVMFYREDLAACGINADEEFTGLCTEIFKKDSVLHELKVYYFIHLSVQEFLAALHVFLCYLELEKDMNLTDSDLMFFLEDSRPKQKELLHVLLRKAIDKAEKSDRGHFDLFLRFLLGISLESNQKLLIGILNETKNSKQSISKTVQYLKQLQNNDKCPDKSINHFFCILELQDRTLYQQIMKYLRSKTNRPKVMSRSNCSALVYVLLMSQEVLDKFNPKLFNKTYAGCRILVPAVRCSRKALFSDCGLTETCFETVALALQLENCPLVELDLSYNYSLEAAVNVMCAGLKSPHCHLESLRLAGCHLGQDSCMQVVSALQSISHRLKELDLSGNDLQDSGLQKLLQGMENTEKRLQVLRLSWCNLTEMSCQQLSTILSSNSVFRELDLSNNDLQDSGVKLLSDGLKSPNCKLKILRLSGCMVTEEGCGFLSSALSSNPSHLRELDLSYNHPGQSGVQLLQHTLEDPHCKLKTLKTDPMGDHLMKPGIMKYAFDLTLDPNTAQVDLLLSDGDRKVTLKEKQPYPDHPERFEEDHQVLSRESLSGRCYWETEWTGQEGTVGVAYESIPRKPDDLLPGRCMLGNNIMSWKITCGSRTHVSHAEEDITVKSPSSGSCKRVGVYVDTTADVLSFYLVSDTLTHLYTFLTPFTQPLYAAFRVDGESVSICPIP